MKISVLKPYGYCNGVANAINCFNTIIKNHCNQPIYLIGWIIHNDEIIKEYKKQNINVLDDKQVDRLTLLKSIKDKDAVIVLSAHGTPIQAKSYALKHFKHVYDLTCPYLLNTFNLIKKCLSNKQDVLYYGYKDHPESKAITSISKNMQCFLDVSELKLNVNKNYVLINQSTIPFDFVNEVYKELTKTHKNIKFLNTTCAATKVKHNQILHLKPNDCLIVIGSKHSNNVNELIKLAKFNHVKSFIVSSINDLSKLKSKDIKKPYLISGTSVSTNQVEKILTKL